MQVLVYWFRHWSDCPHQPCWKVESSLTHSVRENNHERNLVHVLHHLSRTGKPLCRAVENHSFEWLKSFLSYLLSHHVGPTLTHTLPVVIACERFQHVCDKPEYTKPNGTLQGYVFPLRREDGMPIERKNRRRTMQSTASTTCCEAQHGKQPGYPLSTCFAGNTG